MECEFCGSKLQTVSSLNHHKKNNKKCVQLQQNMTGSMNLHSTIEEMQLIINKLESDIQKIQNENSDLKMMINEVRTENSELRAENKIYKKDHETLTSIAKQPKITTNNNTYNLSVYDDNLIKDRFILAINNVKPSDLYGGQKSIGRFVAPCLKNDDGTSMISCTDSSRNVFVYKDIDGNINKDIKCKNLANLIEPIATAKVDELIKVDNSKRYRLSKIESLKNDIIKRQEDLRSLDDHILGFPKNSNKWNIVQQRILQKEKENQRDCEELQKLQHDDIEVNENPFIIDHDEKLADAAEDIKEMKTDSGKFSKTISELVV